MQPNPYQSMNYNIQQAYPQYGYNPYFQQTRMQLPQIEQVQPVNQLQQQMPRGVNGRVVQSVEMITANDVPMDGSAATVAAMWQQQLHRQISREDSTHSLSSENLTVSPTVCVMGSMHRTPL